MVFDSKNSVHFRARGYGVYYIEAKNMYFLYYHVHYTKKKKFFVIESRVEILYVFIFHFYFVLKYSNVSFQCFYWVWLRFHCKDNMNCYLQNSWLITFDQPWICCKFLVLGSESIFSAQFLVGKAAEVFAGIQNKFLICMRISPDLWYRFFCNSRNYSCRNNKIYL